MGYFEGRISWKKPTRGRCNSDGQIAPLVEQGTENPRGGGSIPSLATFSLRILAGALALLSVACQNDACEQLCIELAQRLDGCIEQWPTDWGEFDARGRADFRRTCQQEWAEVRVDLEPRELDDGLDQCSDTSIALNRLRRDQESCDQMRSLYLGLP